MPTTFFQKLAAVNDKKNQNNGEDMITLGLEDVIVGRGKGAYLSEGNRRYMQAVCSQLPRYQAATKNTDKVQITKDIIDAVTLKGGRFLGIDARGKLYNVTEQQARVKVGQALRHKRRQLEGGSERSTSERNNTSERTAGLTSDRSLEECSSSFAGSYRERSELSFRSISHRSTNALEKQQQYLQRHQQHQHPGSYRSVGESHRSTVEEVSPNLPPDSSTSYRSTDADEYSPYVPHGVNSASALTPSLAELSSFEHWSQEPSSTTLLGNNQQQNNHIRAISDLQPLEAFSSPATPQPTRSPGVESAGRALSSMSLTANQALDDDDEYALVLDDDDVRDRLSEFSCLSLTESDRHDLGNMSD
mmetsp:Transcript_6551/g.8513  ORF Transcript_6551/g.8513 Transcript_6551/m.8513 type:complete len:361 (-) Transcript_6551:351-1433(-)